MIALEWALIDQLALGELRGPPADGVVTPFDDRDVARETLRGRAGS